MEQYEGWDALYIELAEIINNKLPNIAWVDLWHNQVGFLQEEHPFPTPALFIAFRITNPENLSEKVQDAGVQIDFYFFYETFADTNMGSFNQESALEYLKTLTDIHKVFHGTSGQNYSELSRVGFSFVDTGTAGNLYRLSYSGKIIDATAQKEWDDVTPGGTAIEEGETPESDLGGDFILPETQP